MLARDLTRINAAEALADYYDPLAELLVDQGETCIQFAHRVARTLRIRQDSGINRAMPEPSAEIRQRRERYVAGHESGNQQDDFRIVRPHARPWVCQRADPVDAGFERHSK